MLGNAKFSLNLVTTTPTVHATDAALSTALRGEAKQQGPASPQSGEEREVDTD